MFYMETRTQNVTSWKSLFLLLSLLAFYTLSTVQPFHSVVCVSVSFFLRSNSNAYFCLAKWTRALYRCWLRRFCYENFIYFTTRELSAMFLNSRCKKELLFFTKKLHIPNIREFVTSFFACFGIVRFDHLFPMKFKMIVGCVCKTWCKYCVASNSLACSLLKIQFYLLFCAHISNGHSQNIRMHVVGFSWFPHFLSAA